MRFAFRGISVALAAFALSACDSDNDIFVPVQVIHAVANAPTVDVTNGAATLFSDIAFKEATGFNSVFYGSTSLVVSADLPDGASLPVIGPVNVPLVEGNSYSILAIGSVGSMNAPIQPLVLANPATAVTAGSVRVQVVHGAANVGPVDIHVTAPMDPIVPANALAGGNTPFGANSARFEVPAANYRIRVTAPGGTTPVFDSGTVTLPAGADLVVVAVDNTVAGRTLADAPPITLLVADGTSQFEILDQATQADLRVVHAVPDANGVDIYVNDPMATGMAAIGNLDYTETVPADGDSYLPWPTGTTNLLVTGAGNPGFIAIPATDVEFEAGKQYTVYASGSVAAGINPFITEDDDRSIATEARTRIIHLAPGAGLVDIYLTPPMTAIDNIDPTFEDVDFGDETGYVSLAGDSYWVTVTLANTKTAAIGPAPINLVDGGVYTAVARAPDVTMPVAPGNDVFGLIVLDDF
jgi:hypothetical protein